jgi:hypothetical protein
MGFDGIVADVDNADENQDQVFEDRVELLHSIRECQVELNEVPLVFVPFRDRSVSYRNKHKHSTAYPGVRLGLGSHFVLFSVGSEQAWGKI